jgi:hypothetical protein
MARFATLRVMGRSTHDLKQTPLTGLFRAVAWLLVACLLLGTLPLRAWAAPGAAGGSFGHAGVNTAAMPPCHGATQDPTPQTETIATEDLAQESMPLSTSPSPSATSCDCCLACSPAAAGSAATWPALPGVGATLPTSAPHAPVQAQRDGVFRPPRA